MSTSTINNDPSSVPDSRLPNAEARLRALRSRNAIASRILQTDYTLFEGLAGKNVQDSVNRLNERINTSSGNMPTTESHTMPTSHQTIESLPEDELAMIQSEIQTQEGIGFRIADTIHLLPPAIENAKLETYETIVDEFCESRSDDPDTVLAMESLGVDGLISDINEELKAEADKWSHDSIVIQYLNHVNSLPNRKAAWQRLDRGIVEEPSTGDISASPDNNHGFYLQHLEEHRGVPTESGLHVPHFPFRSGGTLQMELEKPEGSKTLSIVQNINRKVPKSLPSIANNTEFKAQILSQYMLPHYVLTRLSHSFIKHPTLNHELSEAVGKMITSRKESGTTGQGALSDLEFKFRPHIKENGDFEIEAKLGTASYADEFDLENASLAQPFAMSGYVDLKTFEAKFVPSK
ncbi:uncharacterized protein I206_105370 [Kwoniella pini CBS 10737]|uniref:Uncharacterized protein n=1 Tax=Kwoniella pini CBS 10737 TaxID=1296096 RepID=A0A1B9I4F3_9TREE|nr:uncharacterized protein I206_03721 [Kwoniella pini CBS 10737]OCF50400.1 hypothetical protein I206_03721 [Kwoniella pini CBS 10737]